MFGCCGKEQTIFKDENGEVYQEWMDKNYPPGSKVTVIPNTTSAYAKHIFKMRGEYPTETKVIDPDGNKHEICTCPCHIKGLCVMC